MRCHRHPERIAPHACGVCGRFHCDECLEQAGGEVVCPDCQPAARAAVPTSVAPRKPRRHLHVAGGVLLAAGLIGVLVFLALDGRRGEADVRPLPVLTPGAFDQKMVAAIGALERGAVAVETFRAESGAYPTGWDALVPDLLPAPPADPWSPTDGALVLGAPAWDPAAVLLYSVGPDGQDDGGRVFAAETGVGDLVYVVR